MEKTSFILTDPGNGKLLFKLFSFEDNDHFNYLQRNNYYTLILLHEGEGKIQSDFSEFEFSGKNYFFFSPYQPYIIYPKKAIKGIAIHFHSDFFCIFRYPKEVAAYNHLFNSIYQPPFFSIKEIEERWTLQHINFIIDELKQEGINKNEVLVSYLKIILLHASRIKQLQKETVVEVKSDATKALPILQSLVENIERFYKTKHSAGDYASLLCITPTALAKLSKKHFNKTITELITERIIIEAKRELYLTSKPVKEIAYDLGFEDEFYFSRLFKKNTDVSPQLYRETVGFAKAETL